MYLSNARKGPTQWRWMESFLSELEMVDEDLVVEGKRTLFGKGYR